jgi:hypothetical protein
MKAARLWSKEPDIADWLERARLNRLRGLPQRNGEPRVQEASARFAANVRQGLENLERLCVSSSGEFAAPRRIVPAPPESEGQ